MPSYSSVPVPALTVSAPKVFVAERRIVPPYVFMFELRVVISR